MDSLYKKALDEHAIIAETNPAGAIVAVNSQFERLSGYSSDELLGQNHRILNSGHHSPAFFAELWRTIASGKVWQGEIKNRRKDGSMYWVKTTIVPFFDDRGRIQRYVSLRTDITAQKTAEHAAIKAREKLAEYASILKLEQEALNRKNIALLELIQSFDDEKVQMKAQFRSQVEQILSPIVTQMKAHFGKQQARYFRLLERSIEDLVENVGSQRLDAWETLSPMELQIAESLKRGMSAKEVAGLFFISPRTVGKHCQNIRRKLGITGQRVRLQSYLRSH